MRAELNNQILSFLNNHLSFFQSEEEIKVILANHLFATRLYNNIFIEYNVDCNLLPNYPWHNDKRISIDIVVQQNNCFIPIEIKFKTKRQTLPYHVFGSQINVQLTDQKAHNEGCYSFWKDVKRIEILKERFNLEHSGFVLFISNDSLYQRQPRQNVQYEPFSIHEYRQVVGGTILNWNATRKAIKESRQIKFPPITLANGYSIRWQDMNLTEHKFILI
jgi:hypothetical protein